MDERALAYFRLSLLTLFSYGDLRKLIDYAGSPEEAVSLPLRFFPEAGVALNDTKEAQLLAVRSDAETDRLLIAMEASGTGFVHIEDETYPSLLSEIPEPPLWLYFRGDLPPMEGDRVAVIGARRASPYGREMAGFFGRELAKQGLHVVSGMASGVDGYAQRGALEAQERTPAAGKSFAVLGGGTDVCYPRENIGLFHALLSGGNGLLSERPPGYYSKAFDFPRRNRIISGLSRAVLVIEAAEKSGTLITVNAALEQDREVFALPGRVCDRTSRGCNELLKNGAHVLTCPEDVLQLLGKQVKKDTMKPPRAVLEKKEMAVYECLSLTPVSVDELLEKTGLPAGVLLELLVRLELKGVVKKAGISGYLLAL